MYSSLSRLIDLPIDVRVTYLLRQGDNALVLAQQLCALCGKGVHIDTHEGRVACNGCNMATDNCTCPPER